jgi:hypothetical protein
MHEQDKIERRRREREAIYKDIGGAELPAKHRVWVRLAQIAAQYGPACLIGTLSLAALMIATAKGMTSQMPYLAIVIVTCASLFAVVLMRGRNAETGQYRGKGSAQPGDPRAGPRKARASPGYERG